MSNPDELDVEVEDLKTSLRLARYAFTALEKELDTVRHDARIANGTGGVVTGLLNKTKTKLSNVQRKCDALEKEDSFIGPFWTAVGLLHKVRSQLQYRKINCVTQEDDYPWKNPTLVLNIAQTDYPFFFERIKDVFQGDELFEIAVDVCSDGFVIPNSWLRERGL